MQILVLSGGNSSEREVSLRSGRAVAAALSQLGHKVRIADPAFDKISLTSFKKFLPLLSSDCVFLALHGGDGEDGHLQAILDYLKIPYTGSDMLGSALAMHKDIAKRLFRDQGIPTPDWMVFSPGGKIPEVPFPCVIKPVCGGSSIGVAMPNGQTELRRLLSNATEDLLIEKKVVGREFSIGILGGNVLPPVEIRPCAGFYDYNNKYSGKTEEVCPAPLPAELTDCLGELAKSAFDVLHLRGYARFDFLMDTNNNFWCLEANTLPGMTETSLLPLEARTAGISFPELCDQILFFSGITQKLGQTT